MMSPALRLRRNLFGVLIIALAACSPAKQLMHLPFAVNSGCSRPSFAPFAAGQRSFTFSSPSAPSQVKAEAWYPAAPKSVERPVFYSSAYWGFAAPRAKPAAVKNEPLVILAHGWRGTRFDLSWIGEALARQGYVTVSIDSPDSDAKTFVATQAPKMWFRAELMHELIDATAKDRVLGPLVDTEHSAVVGHSAGGSAAFVLGGAQIDSVRFNHRFPAAAPVVNGDFSDHRIQAIVALNPGTGPVFTEDGLHQVFAPTLILSGDADKVAPEATNAQLYASGVPDATWCSLHNVNHYSFMPVCSPWGRLRNFGTCIESAPLDRAAMHEQALGDISVFFHRVLPTSQAAAAQAAKTTHL